MNPLSGRKRGLEIYQKFVEPLFRLISVRVTLVTTQRTNHSHDYILENGWHNVDGIVSVGGDGTFMEMVNGVIARTAKNSNIDLNDSSVRIPPPAVRIGVIPAGSTDAIAYSLHGTADIQTAVIHIINGKRSLANPLHSPFQLRLIVLAGALNNHDLGKISSNGYESELRITNQG